MVLATLAAMVAPAGGPFLHPIPALAALVSAPSVTMIAGARQAGSRLRCAPHRPWNPRILEPILQIALALGWYRGKRQSGKTAAGENR